MINWVSKTEYYDVETGEQITKSVAEERMITLRVRKETKIIDKSAAYGYEYHQGTITWIHECEKSKQLKIF